MLFLIFFFGSYIFFDNFFLEILYNVVAFVSFPVFLLLGDSMSYISFVLGPPLLILYWIFLGMVIAIVIQYLLLSTGGNH